MTPHERYRLVTRFGSLDGLRALAILAVIWHHGPGHQASLLLLRHGYFGVHLFFVVSGFLITTLLIRERGATGRISLRNFYVRRTLRIFPLYYSTIAVYVLLVWAFRLHEPAGREFFGNLPYFLTYTSNWFVGTGSIGTGPIFVLAWSLATEEQFYCTWPWVEKYGGSRWPTILICFVSAFAFCVTAGWMNRLLPDASFVTTVILSVSLPIGLGVLLAHLVDSPSGFRAVSSVLGHRASSIVSLSALGLALLVETPTVVIYCLLAVLVATCVVREDHYLAPILKIRIITRIGVVSYGMYLFHALVYNLLSLIDIPLRILPDRESVSGFLVAASVTFLIAGASYDHFEARLLRLKERFASGVSAGPARALREPVTEDVAQA
jgi:peptidoglycan/LPS O-acetylase OafA/YrhL